MAKLVIVLGLLVAVASAAPVAEESSPTPEINELLEAADPIENDISAPRTGELTELGKIIAEQIEEAEKSADLDESKSVDSVRADEETVDNESIITYAETLIEEPSIDEVPSQTESEKVTTDDKETRKPVNEVIPPPQVAFVLGDSAVEESPNEENIYQIVQGENEDGTPILSEIVPEGDSATPKLEETDVAIVAGETIPTDITSEDEAVMEGSGFPIADDIDFDYPTIIIPEIDPTSIVAQEDVAKPVDHDNTPGPIDYDMLLQNQDVPLDYDLSPVPDAPIDYDLSSALDVPVDYDVPQDQVAPMDYDVSLDASIPSIIEHPVDEPSYDYNLGSPIDSLHDYESGPTDSDYFHYDTPADPLMVDDASILDDPAQFPSHPDMFNMDYPDIVAGAQETYHPSPISSYMLNEENGHGPDVDYPIYHDEPIVAAAMVNSNPPLSEGFPNTEELDYDFYESAPRPSSGHVDLLQLIKETLKRDGLDLDTTDPMKPFGFGTNMIKKDEQNNAVNIPLESSNDKADIAENIPLESSNDKTDIAENIPLESSNDKTDIGEIVPLESSNNTPDIVIELNIGNQDAVVNGRPFDLRQSATILDFIEKLMFKVTKTDTVAQANIDSRSTFPSYSSRPFDFRYFDSSFLNPYSSSEEMNSWNYPYYRPYSNEFDYNPYFPLSNPLIFRSLRPNLHSIKERIPSDRFGFDNNVRERRFAYDPLWHYRINN